MTSPSRLQQRTFQTPGLKLPVSLAGQTCQRVQTGDVFTPPSTPRSQFYVTQSPQNTQMQVNSATIRQRVPENDLFTVVNSNPEMTRQLRELLQKQQIEAVVGDQQQTQTRIWVQGGCLVGI